MRQHLELTLANRELAHSAITAHKDQRSHMPTVGPRNKCSQQWLNTHLHVVANAARVHVVGVNDNKWGFYIVTSLECRVHLLSARYEKKKTPPSALRLRQRTKGESFTNVTCVICVESRQEADKRSALRAQCNEV